MKEYTKINTIFKRDMSNKGKIIIGEYAQPEFEYLKDNKWYFTEKIDGTNIRIEWLAGHGIKLAGRTDNAQIPSFLYDRLNEIFPPNKIDTCIDKTDSLVLYGEGYGAKIQKGGGNYIPDGCDFILFDVLVDGWWLKREDVVDVAVKLGIKYVPITAMGTLSGAVELAEHGFDSQIGNCIAEGLVIKPIVELQTRAGNRIITKIKHKDFK